jgi:hypothetical protein
MTIKTYLVLLAAVIGAAGATIALFWALGASWVWLGLGALLLAIVLRKPW